MKWQPLQRAVIDGPPSEALIAETMRSYPYLTRTGAIDLLETDAAKCEWWRNNIYQVEVRRQPETESVHLNIRRIDGQPIMRDWRHFQRIKNQLVGEECEAVELYPAESRLVDTSNKYHLWACSDPTFRFPFGFKKRDTRSAAVADCAGLIQREVEDNDT